MTGKPAQAVMSVQEVDESKKFLSDTAGEIKCEIALLIMIKRKRKQLTEMTTTTLDRT